MKVCAQLDFSFVLKFVNGLNRLFLTQLCFSFIFENYLSCFEKFECEMIYNCGKADVGYLKLL